jgi:hypothetical protein
MTDVAQVAAVVALVQAAGDAEAARVLGLSPQAVAEALAAYAADPRPVDAWRRAQAEGAVMGWTCTRPDSSRG